MADDTNAPNGESAAEAAADNEAQTRRSLADEVGLELSHSRYGKAPADPSMPPPLPGAPQAPVQDLNGDIARILDEVKLPERRGPAAEVPAPGHQYDTTLGATASSLEHGAAPQNASAPEPPPASPGAAEPYGVIVPPGSSEHVAEAPAAESEPSPVVALHTMKTDLQDIVREEKMSLVRAAAIAEDHKAKDVPPVAVMPRKKGHPALTIFAAFIFVLLGASAIGGVYLVTHTVAPSQQIAQSSIMFAESTVALPIDGVSASALKQDIAAAVAAPQVGEGEILQIIPTTAAASTSGSGAQSGQQPATLSQFLAALGADPPSDLINALSSNFFFGIHNVGGGSPVFVIPVISYDNAFAGMLAWEPTIDDDLAPIFEQVPTITAGANGLPVTRQFQDAVMRNYDVRELEDDQGNVVLYYSFPTPDVLVISASPYTFPEVLSRLQAAGKL